MKSHFRGFFVALMGLAIVACACSKDEGDAPKSQPKAERYEVFKLEDPNSIPYRIPALAVTESGTLIAVSDYRHSGTDIGVTNYGRMIRLMLRFRKRTPIIQLQSLFRKTMAVNG